MLCHTSLFVVFICLLSLFIRILLNHITVYNVIYIYIYIIIISYETFVSTLVFYKISTSNLQFLKDFDAAFYSFYQGSHRILQLLKLPCHISFLPMWSLTLGYDWYPFSHSHSII